MSKYIYKPFKVQVDSDLKPFVDDFIRDFGLGRDVSVTWNRERVLYYGKKWGCADELGGVSVDDEPGGVQVYLSPRWKDMWTKDHLKMMIYHEMGHAVFALGHNEEQEVFLGRKIPVSLMTGNGHNAKFRASFKKRGGWKHYVQQMLSDIYSNEYNQSNPDSRVYNGRKPALGNKVKRRK